MTPELILTNGHIITADGEDGEAEAVACWNGRIISVGSSSDIKGLGDGTTKVVDLKGRTVLPGLTDPHVHFADGGAAMMNRIDCRDFYANVRAIPQITDKIRAQASEQPASSWIVAHGSPMQDFRMPEGRFPNRQELDAAAPDHPVVINFGAHITIANSKALELAGSGATPRPPTVAPSSSTRRGNPPASWWNAPSSWSETSCPNTTMAR